MGSFCKNHIKFQLKKITEELPPITLKSDANFKEKLACSFKYGMSNFARFHSTTQKSKNFTSMGCFYPKFMNSELKNTEELSFMTLTVM